MQKKFPMYVIATLSIIMLAACAKSASSDNKSSDTKAPAAANTASGDSAADKKVGTDANSGQGKPAAGGTSAGAAATPAGSAGSTTDNKKDGSIAPKKSAIIAQIVATNGSSIDALKADASLVLFNGQLMHEGDINPAISPQTKDTSCKIEITDSIVVNDKLKLKDKSKPDLDQATGNHKTVLTFAGDKGSVKLTCTHGTDELSSEDLAFAVNKVFDIIKPDQKSISTDDRFLAALKIADANILGQLDQTKALVDGKIVSRDEALAKMKDGSIRMACSVHNKVGDLSVGKLFYRTDKGAIPLSNATDKTTSSYAIYTADDGSLFVLSCRITTDVAAIAVLPTTGGAFTFGVLSKAEFEASAEVVKSLEAKTKDISIQSSELSF